MASFVSPSSSSIIACLLFVIVSFLQGLVAAAGVTFTFTNRCGGTAHAGGADGVVGPVLGAHGCAFDGTSGGKCATGTAAAARPSATARARRPRHARRVHLGDGDGGKEDYYDVSLVDGYNVPVVVEPSAAGARRRGAWWTQRAVPGGAEGAGGRGCRSACEAFDRPEYCCSGAFGGPDTCRPSAYSQAFKAACPRAYSYAYDDATSTFTCAYSGTAAYPSSSAPRRRHQQSSNDPLPRPGDVVAGAQVAADTWLASLATGENGAAVATTAGPALRAALAAAVALLVSSL
ncbi:hypothetical protein ZWY2020_003820 [Hordeum vulgare]|nr:hypothetical protein ZWY2020_003820 [Hordeum vulgare]